MPTRTGYGAPQLPHRPQHKPRPEQNQSLTPNRPHAAEPTRKALVTRESRVSLLGSETVSSEEARGADDADHQTEAGAGSETAGQATESPSGTAADPKGSAATGDGTDGPDVSAKAIESEETNSGTGTGTGAQAIPAVTPGVGLVSEVSPTTSEMDRGDASDPAADVAASSRSVVSQGFLMGIVGAVALAAAGSAAFLGLRLARRRIRTLSE